MKIYGLKDLEYRRLHEGDVVIFHVKDKQGEFVDLKYEVKSDYLTNISEGMPVEHYNDEIFKILGLNPFDFCYKHYGYRYKGGDWPYYKNHDFEAATNAVKALYTLIDSMNMMSSFPGDLCANIIWNGKEFGYNDIDGGWKRIDVGGSTCSTTSFSNNGASNCSTTSSVSTSSSDMPIDKLKKISSQIKTIKEDNSSKLKRV